MQVNKSHEGAATGKSGHANQIGSGTNSLSQFKTVDTRQNNQVTHTGNSVANYGHSFNATTNYAEPQRPSSSKLSLF